MGTVQKYLVIIAGLGAGYMVLAHPDSFYKVASGVNKLAAGSVVAVTTGGKGKVA